ncbi:DNA mismatch repair protein Msh6p [Diutina catenulata]
MAVKKQLKQQSLSSFFKPMASSSPAKVFDADTDKENLTPPSSQPASSPIKATKRKAEVSGDEPVTKKASPKQAPPVEVAKPVKSAKAIPKPVKKEVKPKAPVVADSDSDADMSSGPDVSDDSGDEFEPGTPSASEDEDEEDVVADEEPDTASEDEDDDIVVAPKRKKRSPGPAVKQEAPAVAKSPSAPSSLTHFDASSSYQPSGPKGIRAIAKPAITAKPSFAKVNEERYQWLLTIKDAAKRTQDHPDYDPRTLYIPASAWQKFTAFERQYWEIKSKMWDTVVFFKKGKFYELYENDAFIANSQFDLKIAGGGRANMQLAGIPEMSFEYWAKQFIQAGYKVAKVDQKESMLAKEMRGGGTKEEKIIKRELTGVLTGGTLTDLDMLSGDAAVYCMAVRQEGSSFGVALVDTATGSVQLCELEDDVDASKLDTLVSQVRPKEVLVEKNNLNPVATKIIKYAGMGQHQIWNTLTPVTEFWDNGVAKDYITQQGWWAESGYPQALESCSPLAFHAFGGLLYYLTTLKLDGQIMSMANFSTYSVTASSRYMGIDGTTLANLEILANNDDGTDRGTLLRLVNRAVTPMGRRRMRQWTMLPLANAEALNQRLDSVDFLMETGSFRVKIDQLLNGLPDLERLVARVHAGSLRFREFVKVVESFERLVQVPELREYVPASTALASTLAQFPDDLASAIGEWDGAFDRKRALEDEVVPADGVDAAYDESRAEMDRIEDELASLLKEYRSQFGSKELVYKDSGKEIYLLEVPNRLGSKVPGSWMQMGSTSKVKRYWSPEGKKLARRLMEQRETHKSVCDALRGNLYRRFDAHRDIYTTALDVVSRLDCLVSLARVSESLGSPSVRPEFIEGDVGALDFADLRNPVYCGEKEFIPNDVSLGGDSPRFGLLTGANAAGKSTLMRTTCLAVMLAQMGCYVPASRARLVPVDRIMTRLGAQDNILQGKSTFYVELSETKKMVASATPKSLVIVDELGRGGSSGDGFAIAEAVLHHLATHVQPLGFFATHFGSLVDAFANHPQVKPWRMQISVDDSTRTITFMYKLEPGRAPGSFGMHVAAMCGISPAIVDAAEVAAATNKAQKRVEGDSDQLGVLSDFSWYVTGRLAQADPAVNKRALAMLMEMV